MECNTIYRHSSSVDTSTESVSALSFFIIKWMGYYEQPVLNCGHIFPLKTICEAHCMTGVRNGTGTIIVLGFFPL
jgi:hypothetical protein